MTTLSLLKSREEFGSLRVRPLFNKPMNPCPHREWVLQEITKWSKGFSHYNQKTTYAALLFTEYLFNGYKSRERLLNANKLMEFFVYMDNDMERARRERSPELLRELMDKLLNAMESGRCDQGFDSGRRLLDVMSILDAQMNECWKSNMRQHLRNMFVTQTRVHCDYWLKDRFIPYDEYNDIRLQESGWPLMLTLVEYLMDYTLPEAVRNHPLMYEFMSSAAKLSLAVDDYMLLKAKLATNDITSGVLSYAHSQGCSVQSALDFQYMNVKHLERECQSLRTTIMANPTLSAEPLDPYMDVIIQTSYGMYCVFQEILKFEVRDGVLSCEKWDQLNQLVVDSNVCDVNPFKI